METNILNDNNALKHHDNSCLLCNEKFTDDIFLNDHKKLHCKIKNCNARLSNINELHIHTLNHKIYKCKYCFKRYHNKNTLTTHIFNKHNELVLKCNVCNKNFISLNTLSKHILIHSPDIYKHRCVICNNYYKTHYYLKQHIINVHNKIIINCVICNKKCSVNNMYKHYNRFHYKKSINNY